LFGYTGLPIDMLPDEVAPADAVSISSRIFITLFIIYRWLSWHLRFS
jgi:hypothetical protein